jgi:hypothetical protein
LQFSSDNQGFFVPEKVRGYDGDAKRESMAMDAAKKKSRVFAPVTLKMIYEAAPRPDDVLEIEGENIADVSEVELT